MTPPQGLAVRLAEVSPFNVSVSVRDRAQKRCESRGGRPGFLVPNNPYGLCDRKATLRPNCKGRAKS